MKTFYGENVNKECMIYVFKQIIFQSVNFSKAYEAHVLTVAPTLPL